jgi:Ca-activated chloride channel family protein
MPRHLTLADVGRGASRHRAPQGLGRWLIRGGALLALLAAAGLGLPPTRAGLVNLVGAVGGDQCPNGRTELVVASSADKANTLTRMAADFSAGGTDASGRCVHVTILTKASGAAFTELAQGWPTERPRPDVWSPSGSLWLPLLEDRLATSHQSSLIAAPNDPPRIATSPLVVAMPRPMAAALGWPGKPIGWSDLLSLATNQTGWAAFGHPEWGPFLLGKTNPNFSHAGLEGTIATYYAAVGRSTGLTVADVQRADTRKFVAGVEQSIVRYGDTTVSFAADWRLADDAGHAMSYLSAMVTEESLVAAYNDGNPSADPKQAGKNSKPKVPLVAIYPKEGTLLADHPYAVLTAPWVTPAKRDAAAVFLAYLRSPAGQRTWQANNFRDDAGRPGAQVTAANGMLPDQPTTVLQPPAPTVVRAILDGWSQLRKTADVISLIDVSGSMAEPVPGATVTRLDAAKQAAISSLDLFTSRDEVGLWSFSGGVPGVKDYTEQVPIGPMSATLDGQTRHDALQRAIKGLAASGNTGLYNSIAAAYQAVQDRYQPGRINAVVVLTDGRNDAQGGLTLDQLLGRLLRDNANRPVRLITIAYGPDADQATLAKIARATKGAAYVAPSPADIPKVYSAALSNI